MNFPFWRLKRREKKSKLKIPSTQPVTICLSVCLWLSVPGGHGRSVNWVHLHRAGSPPYIPAQPGSSRPIILFTCHSVPLSIKRTTKQRRSSPRRRFLVRPDSQDPARGDTCVCVYVCCMNRKYKPDLQAAVTLIFPRLSGRAKIQSCVGSACLGRHGGEREKKKKDLCQWL